MTFKSEIGPTGKITGEGGPKPPENPELNPGPNVLKFTFSIAAGRHCHRLFVDGCGIKFCNDCIAPLKVFDASSVSESPRARHARGFESRCIYHPICLVFFNRSKARPKRRRSSVTTCARSPLSSFICR